MSNKLPSEHLPEDIFEQGDTDNVSSTVTPPKKEPEPPQNPEPYRTQVLDDVLGEEIADPPQAVSDEKSNESHETVPLAPPLNLKHKDAGTVESPSVDDIKIRSDRDRQKKSSSTFLKIILIAFVVVVVLIAAGASFIFFDSRIIPVVETNGVPVVPAIPDTSLIEDEDILPEDIDTTNWQEYENTNAGLSFSYPEDFTLQRNDENLGAANASGTPQLILKSSSGAESITIWMDTTGISQFISPTAPTIGNPLNAGVHFILGEIDSGLEVKNTRYFSNRSGIIQSDLDSITAYIPEQSGVWQYTLVYIDSQSEEASELFMKTFIEGITLRLDRDSDGLFDDEEEKFGTDPLIKDTDGDGFNDKEEVSNGYNPLGEGLLNS